MRTVSIEIPWAPCIRLVLMGDAHVGHAGCQEELLRDTVASVSADESAYLLDLGDSIDAINRDDKRFSPQELAGWMTIADLVDIARTETERYANLVRPAASHLLTRLKGNHEATLCRYYGRDVYAELNRAVGLPPGRALGICGFLRLLIRERYATRKGSRRAWERTLFLHHGNAGGRLMGAKALALERLPMSFHADIYAMGHSHTKLTSIKERITPDGPEQVALVNVGSFLRSYQQDQESYAEVKLLSPQGIGPVEVWLYPDERRMLLVT
jgi:predicted phosphodiesterase